LKKDTKRVDKVEKRYYNVSIRYKTKENKEMKKFEVGKIYRQRKYYSDVDVEIKVVRRTDKTITFVYTKANWWKDNITKEYRKKISYYGRDEVLYLGDNWAAPSIDSDPIEEVTETAEVS
jgi:hypothetical protein